METGLGCSWGCWEEGWASVVPSQHPSQGKMALGASLSYLLLSKRLFKQNIANSRVQCNYLLADTNYMSRIKELQN